MCSSPVTNTANETQLSKALKEDLNSLHRKAVVTVPKDKDCSMLCNLNIFVQQVGYPYLGMEERAKNQTLESAIWSELLRKTILLFN